MGTALPEGAPFGLTEAFSADAQKQSQWSAFLGRNRLAAPPLAAVVVELRAILFDLDLGLTTVQTAAASFNPSGHHEPTPNDRRHREAALERADNLRANSNYASNEYFMPVMGLIFLRHAYNRFLTATREIEASCRLGAGTRATSRPRTSPAAARSTCDPRPASSISSG